MAAHPEPRPALRREPDGSVHPEARHLSSLAVDTESIVKARKKAKKKGKDKTVKPAADDDVTLTVTMPKRERKRLRKKAQSYGWTPEEAATHVLRVWSDS